MKSSNNHDSTARDIVVPYIDYDGDGFWVFGFLKFDKNRNKKFEPLEKGDDIEELIQRVVATWNIEAGKLWVCELGTYILQSEVSGK